MLRIRMLSGDEVVDIPVRELSDVKSLKKRLQQVHGLPPRFRQRISSRGSILEDTAKLDSSMDLELVLLPCSVASQAQADELVTATHSASEADLPKPCRFKGPLAFNSPRSNGEFKTISPEACRQRQDTNCS